MKWLFGWPTRGHWRLLKPSRVTSRGLARNKGKEHRLVLAAEVEVMPEPIVKVVPIVTYEMYALGPLMNPCPGGVTFNDPKVKKSPKREETNCLTEPSTVDIETWLEFQAQQLGTPTWWEELGAIPGIEDLCKFAQKIRASFYIPELQMRASLEQGYTMPLPP